MAAEKPGGRLGKKKSFVRKKSSQKNSSFYLDHIDDTLIVINAKQEIIKVNREFSKLWGYSSEEVLGKSVFNIFPKDEIPKHRAEMEKAITTKKPRYFETVALTKSDKKVPISIKGSVFFDNDGKLEGFIGIFRDITETQKIQAELRKSEEKYRSLVESTEDSIYLVDKDYKYLFINKNHMTRMGFSGAEYQGRTYHEFHSPDETKWFVENVDKVFLTGKSVQHEHKSRRDGRYFLQTLSPVKEADGGIRAVTIVSKDINKLKTMEEKFHSLSITDELTGVFNRRGFFTLADQQLKLANRHKIGIFMLYADLDGLKMINDTFGHKEGDLALIEMANLLKDNYRDSDIIARIGGDEFVVIPVGTTGDDIEIIITRFENALNIYNEKMNRNYKLLASVGIAYYDPEKPCSLDELLTQADRMMYKKKRHHPKS